MTLFRHALIAASGVAKFLDLPTEHRSFDISYRVGRVEVLFRRQFPRDLGVNHLRCGLRAREGVGEPLTSARAIEIASEIGGAFHILGPRRRREGARRAWA